MKSKRFKELSNGVIKDTETGLEWAPTTREMDWDEAVEYCKNLKIGSKKGWRLPTVKELLTLVDCKKYDPATDMPGMKSTWYWSSDEYVPSTSHALYVNFYVGYVNAVNRVAGIYVRPVRGGSGER